MVDSIRFKQAMSDKGLTQEYLADKLKIAQSSLNLKIHNSRSFTIEEMFTLSEIFGLKSLKQVKDIFLN